MPFIRAYVKGVPLKSNTKVCTQCHRDLDLCHFSLRNKQRGIYQSWCKECSAEKKKSSSSTPGFRKVKEENSLYIKRPEIAAQWSDKNTISPKEISPSSMFKVWWVCSVDNSHVWSASPNSRSSGKGCPLCCGKTAIPGKNDIATTHPELAELWGKDNEKNPCELKISTKEKISFVFPCGHKYVSTPSTLPHQCPYCHPPQNLLSQHAPELRQEYAKNNVVSFDNLTYNSSYRALWKCSQGHQWEAVVYQRVNGKTQCPQCVVRNSQAEDDIYDFLLSFIPSESIIRHDRGVVNGKELDFYLPYHQVAIEFNGLYWHTEDKGCPRKYHYNKWKECHDKGIQLITIWEDDWEKKPQLIMDMLAYKLKASDKKKVYARNAHIVRLDTQAARDFLNKYHIQGFVPGTYYYGLKDDKGDIVAVSVWRKNATSLYLDRYATSCSVVGGMGKMLKNTIKNHGDLFQEIVTFSDHCVSDGGLYETLGFYRDREIRPDYCYIVNKERVHKFNYRIQRFQRDDDLIFFPGLSESELAKENNLYRLWDCGKTRWVKNLDKKC